MATLMPALLQLEVMSSTSAKNGEEPVATSCVRTSLAPAAIPAPHCVGPDPGLAHVSVPLGTTFHPCDLSKDTAWLRLNGYGFCCRALDRKEVWGVWGIGPRVGNAKPCQMSLEICGWLIRDCRAWRM